MYDIIQVINEYDQSLYPPQSVRFIPTKKYIIMVEITRKL